MNRAFKAITLAAAAALVSALAIACGDSSDADPGLSRAEVAEIARSEMASAAEPGLTREEVAEIAQAAVVMADADRLTSSDVYAIARETMAGMAAMAPGDGGLTRTDVDAMIEAEMAKIPPPVPAAPGLTAADVERIVQKAIADIPQAESGLTAAEVEKIARAAMPVSPPPIPPEPSLSAAEVEEIARGVVASIPYRSNPAAYTEHFVEVAIARYESNGLGETLDYYNTMDSVDEQWYAFIIDEDDVIIGHYNPEVVGLDVKGPIGVDITGYNFGLDMIKATEEGKWVSYIFLNPATGELESKHSWVVKYDGMLFGSGWYTDPDSYTQYIVGDAIERYESEGLDATVAHYSDPENIDGQWYVVILDTADETVLAHYNPEVAGQPATGPIGTDVNGYEFGAEMMKATGEGMWVEFVFMHPVTGTQEDKRSWAVRHDGLVFTTGWYPVASDRDADPGEFAKAFVDQALAYFAANGREETLARYNSVESMDGDWYVFILEDRDGDLYTIAHASRPDLVGTTRDRIDASGFNYGEAFAAVSEAGGGEWVSYLFTHPTTREDAPKHTWVERRGDLLFGAGWYEK